MIKKIFLITILFFSIHILHAQTGETTDFIAKQDTTSLTLVEKIEKWYENNMNYWSITALMTIESSFVPFPSEIVIPPAAYIASKPESKLNIFGVVLFGTLGALLGAFINYGLALWLGRPILYKFADSKLGRVLLLSSEKIQKAETYFNKRGNVSTFIGRLIPGIRQLISVPAGLAKMNIASFALYTTLGAGIWNVVLVILGYLAHGQADLIKKYSGELSIGIGILFVFVILYFIFNYLKKRKNKKD
jgi:membrane protein DedA with SNARE-associated domain